MGMQFLADAYKLFMHINADRFTNSNSQIQRMGDEDVFDKNVLGELIFSNYVAIHSHNNNIYMSFYAEQTFNDVINRITEMASKGQYGKTGHICKLFSFSLTIIIYYYNHF